MALAVGSPASLRQANQRRVVGAIRERGAMTQAEIARATGLSPATVSNVVRQLASAGMLDVTANGPGRRHGTTVAISRRSGLCVGIDFGHRHLRVVLGNLAFEVIGEERRPLSSDHTATDGIRLAEQIIALLLKRAGSTSSDVIGVGLGLPGPIDRRTGEIGSSSILPGWVGIRAADVLSDRLGKPTHVDNDANLGALAEFVWGSARGARNSVYLKVSTGIGAGLIIGGRIHRGAFGTAGEIGHTTIDEDGRVCRCGNRGCLEMMAGAPVIVELLKPRLGDDLTIADAVALALEGDAGCRRVIADAGRHIGVAVANLCNLVNPASIVVGGDLAAAGELLLDPLREAVARRAIPGAITGFDIVVGELGDRAEVLGALALALMDSPVVDLGAGSVATTA